MDINSDDYLNDIFYDEYFYKAIIYRVSYDEWKAAFVEQVNNFIPKMKEYARVISFAFVRGSYAGIILETINYKIKKKSNSEIKSVE